MNNDSIDWEWQYTFDEKGEVDLSKTQRHRLNEPLNVSKKPVPALPEGDRAVAELMLQRIEDALRPGRKIDFAGIFTNLSFHCGLANVEPQVRMRIGDDFWYDLGGYPIAIIEEVCIEWRRSGEERARFMPRPGDLLPNIKGKASKLHRKAHRLRSLLGRSHPEGFESLASIYGNLSAPTPLSELLK